MKSFFYFLLFILIVSCTSSNTIYDEPEDLIPEDTMKLLLTDMYLAGSAKNLKTKSSKKHGNYLPIIYEKYGIDSTRFHNSNIFYTSKIEEYNEILTVVKDSIQDKLDYYERLVKIEEDLKKQKKENKKKERKQNDSITKAQNKKGYVPALRVKVKTNYTRFYDNDKLYNSKIKEYKEYDVLVKKHLKKASKKSI